MPGSWHPGEGTQEWQHWRFQYVWLFDFVHAHTHTYTCNIYIYMYLFIYPFIFQYVTMYGPWPTLLDSVTAHRLWLIYIEHASFSCFLGVASMLAHGIPWPWSPGGRGPGAQLSRGIPRITLEHDDMVVSWVIGLPPVIHLSGIFPYKPTILGYHLWKPPYIMGFAGCFFFSDQPISLLKICFGW